MQFKIKTKNLNLSDDQKEMIQSKVEKLQHLADRLSDESTEFRIELKHEQSRKASDAYSCQLTIFAPNAVIRSETRSESIENIVDECVAKMKSQIERYKSKIHHANKKFTNAGEMEEPPKEEGEFEIPKILRRKRFSATAPMTEDEAIERMELLGHSFFIFNNDNTSRFSLIYKRKDGYYGIIEPKKEND